MCGIGGWLGDGSRQGSDALLAALRHRGPDGEGTWSDPDGRAVLVHTRLAIIDLSSGGAQPMTAAATPDGTAGVAQTERYAIVFNGEIYNYAALRGDLEKAGETFAGHSDTEVLLKLLIRFGE